MIDTKGILIPDFKNLNQLDFVMCNLDREIDRDIEKQLKEDSNTYSMYTGWNFCGYTWFDKLLNKFHCQVWIYQAPFDIYSADTLEEIMTIVSNEHGYE